MKYTIAEYIKSFFVTIEPKKVYPKKPKNTMGYPLSWISQYFGYIDCMYGIRGQGETEGKYYLWDWLKECEKTMEENGGWITAQEVILDGVVTNSIVRRNIKSNLPYDSNTIRNINYYVGVCMKKVDEVRKENKQKQNLSE